MTEADTTKTEIPRFMQALDKIQELFRDRPELAAGYFGSSAELQGAAQNWDFVNMANANIDPASLEHIKDLALARLGLSLERYRGPDEIREIYYQLYYGDLFLTGSEQ